jgi:DNA-binding NtrC family response regulator
MTAPDAPLPGMLGGHPRMREVYRLVRRAAPTDLPVLILGETGTGKELVARALHDLSGRRGPFVAFNVGAISELLVEDALFGHVRGAFSGAVAGGSGYLREADGGTAFLDEIGALPLSVQPKLLRAIETRQFRPIGGQADVSSDFRVVAATNADLADLVRRELFRADLAHRMAVIVVALPPLRDRLGDLPLLAREFARQAGLTLGAAGTIDESALAALRAHSWSGNVRELKHAIEAANLLSAGPAIGAREVYAALAQGRARPAASDDDRTDRAGLAELLASVEWDTTALARVLGVHRATVYRRLKRLGLCGRRGPYAASGATDSHLRIRSREFARIGSRPGP